MSRTRGKLLLASLALLVVGLVALLAVNRHQFWPKNFGVVESGRIYRSGQISAPVIRGVLAKYGIKRVIDLNARELALETEQTAEEAACLELGASQLRLPLKGDGTGDIMLYARALRELREAGDRGEPVLIHCAAGTQRTGTLVFLYRVLLQGKSVDVAIAELEEYGWKPEKDGILLDYLRQEMPRLIKVLVEEGTLAKEPAQIPVLPLPGDVRSR